MTRAINIALLTFSAFAVGACTTMVDGISASGRVREVSTEDIRAAVAADIRAHPTLSASKPSHVEVISVDEIHLYWPPRNVYGGSDIVKRVRGRWQFYGQVIVTG